MLQLEIVYEDNHIIAVNKPAGIAVQAAKQGERDLLVEVKELIKVRDNKPGNVFLGLIHRIDRPVSGIVLFAKTSKGASRLSEQIREGSIEKTYEAIVHGNVQRPHGTLEHRLEKVAHKGGYKAVVVKNGGDLSRLHYTKVDSNATHSLLRIDLETGRFHQIRAQLSAMGHPIVGDSLYGSKDRLPSDAIMLRAVAVAFNHATTKERITLSVPSFSLPN